MKIVSFGQQVMLDAEMTVLNQLTVELADGRQVSVPAAEETVQALMKLHAGIPVETEVFPPQPAEHVSIDADSLPRYEEEDDEEYDPGEIGNDAVMGTLGERPAAPEMSIPAIGQPQPPRPKPQPRVDADGYMIPPRAKTVPKDEMGYPIVSKKTPPQQRQLIQEDDDGEQI